MIVHRRFWVRVADRSLYEWDFASLAPSWGQLLSGEINHGETLPRDRHEGPSCPKNSRVGGSGRSRVVLSS